MPWTPRRPARGRARHGGVGARRASRRAAHLFDQRRGRGGALRLHRRPSFVFLGPRGRPSGSGLPAGVVLEHVVHVPRVHHAQPAAVRAAALRRGLPHPVRVRPALPAQDAAHGDARDLGAGGPFRRPPRGAFPQGRPARSGRADHRDLGHHPAQGPRARAVDPRGVARHPHAAHHDPRIRRRHGQRSRQPRRRARPGRPRARPGAEDQGPGAGPEQRLAAVERPAAAAGRDRLSAAASARAGGLPRERGPRREPSAGAGGGRGRGRRLRAGRRTPYRARGGERARQRAPAQRAGLLHRGAPVRGGRPACPSRRGRGASPSSAPGTATPTREAGRRPMRRRAQAA